MGVPVGPLTLFWLVLKASLLSTGGLGNAPSLHADLVRPGFATEGQFSASLAVGQLSPGPSGLWVVALGYALGGGWGAVAALVAVCLPPLFTLAVAALVRRAGEHPGVEGFVWGLGVTVAGTSAATMLRLVRGEGFRMETILISFTALFLGLRGKVPVVAVLAGAAAIGFFWR